MPGFQWFNYSGWKPQTVRKGPDKNSDPTLRFLGCSAYRSVLSHGCHFTQPTFHSSAVSCWLWSPLEKNISAVDLSEQHRVRHGKLTTKSIHLLFLLAFKLPNLDEVYFTPSEKSPRRAHRVLYKNTALILEKQCKLHSPL